MQIGNDYEQTTHVAVDGFHVRRYGFRGRIPENCRGVSIYPCLGEGRDCPSCSEGIWQSLYGCRGLGGFEGTGLRETLLRLLGRPGYLSRASDGNLAWGLDMEERVAAGRSGFGCGERVFHRCGLDAGTERGESVSARDDPAVRQWPRLSVCGRHTLFSIG